MNRIAVVRVRGPVGVNKKINDALRMLRLSRVNFCSIIDDRDSYQGTLRKVKDYVTWGSVSEKDVSLVLRKRGELVGGSRLTDEYVNEKTEFKSIEDFAKSFINFKAELDDIPNIKLFFRLHPPRKGHGGIKRSFSEGGALGRRDKLGPLLYRMR